MGETADEDCHAPKYTREQLADGRFHLLGRRHPPVVLLARARAARTVDGMGISDGGRSAEERYLLATGATKSAKSGDGDAVLAGYNVEVKKATAATLNQVRAVKYIPLVALHEPTDTWYVVPAHVVVCLVSSKARGQHTENPFESAALNIFALGKYKLASEKDLKQATLDAIADANKYPDLRKAMEAVLKDSKDLAAKSVREVKTLIAELKIVP